MGICESPSVSIVILTFNRKDRVLAQMTSLASLTFSPLEIVVVDNCSEETVDDIVLRDSRAVLVRNETNLGAVGRNRGMEVAGGDIIVTLDDDVYGITDDHLRSLCRLMRRNDLAAVVFKVTEEATGRIVNWCHPYDPDRFSGQELETNEISEGAVAFKRTALREVGLYPEYFFISHEGPDLAMRLINHGWTILYSPEIVVLHAFDGRERASWRRYYFDTRNQLWLVLRNCSFFYGMRRLAIGWGSMLVYALRDGYLSFWFRGVWAALRGIGRAWRDRVPPTAQARARWRSIERHKPGFWIMARKRLFGKGVRI